MTAGCGSFRLPGSVRTFGWRAFRLTGGGSCGHPDLDGARNTGKNALGRAFLAVVARLERLEPGAAR